MNLENNPDEVWQCNVCDKSFQSYFELKNHWHSIHIMDPKNKRLTKQDIKDMESQVTKTLIKKEEKKNTQSKNDDVSNSKKGSSGVKNGWMTIIHSPSLSEFDELEFSKEYEPIAKRTRTFRMKKMKEKIVDATDYYPEIKL